MLCHSQKPNQNRNVLHAYNCLTIAVKMLLTSNCNLVGYWSSFKGNKTDFDNQEFLLRYNQKSISFLWKMHPNAWLTAKKRLELEMFWKRWIQMNSVETSTLVRHNTWIDKGRARGRLKLNEKNETSQSSQQLLSIQYI